MARILALETTQTLTAKHRFLHHVQQLPPGTEFTSDDLHEVIGETSTPQEWGTYFKSPEFRALAEPAGAAVSQRNGNLIRIWRIKDTLEVAA